MGRRLGGSAPSPFWRRGAASPSNTMSLGLRPTSLPSAILMHPTIWRQQIWAENWEGYAPFWGREAGSPSNRAKAYLHPSFILIHPTVWPKHTNVTDRQDRQTGQDRQRSDSIGRTVLQSRPKDLACFTWASVVITKNVKYYLYCLLVILSTNLLCVMYIKCTESKHQVEWKHIWDK